MAEEGKIGTESSRGRENGSGCNRRQRMMVLADDGKAQWVDLLR